MKLHYVLLGLIKIHPAVSGYDLKKIITDSTQFFFNAHLSQIYPALKKMTEDEWVIFERQPLNGIPDRKLYSLTAEGDRVLQDWLEAPLEFPYSKDRFTFFMLKLTFMGGMDNNTIANLIRQEIDFFKREREKITKDNLSIEKGFISQGVTSRDRYIYLWQRELECILEEHNFKIAWLEKLLGEVKQGIDDILLKN